MMNLIAVARSRKWTCNAADSQIRCSRTSFYSCRRGRRGIGGKGKLFEELLKCDRSQRGRPPKAGTSHPLLRVSFPGLSSWTTHSSPPPIHQHFLSIFRGDSRGRYSMWRGHAATKRLVGMETLHTAIASLGHLSSSSISCDSVSETVSNNHHCFVYTQCIIIL